MRRQSISNALVDRAFMQSYQGFSVCFIYSLDVETQLQMHYKNTPIQIY